MWLLGATRESPSRSGNECSGQRATTAEPIPGARLQHWLCVQAGLGAILLEAVVCVATAQLRCIAARHTMLDCSFCRRRPACQTTRTTPTTTRATSCAAAFRCRGTGTDGGGPVAERFRATVLTQKKNYLFIWRRLEAVPRRRCLHNGSLGDLRLEKQHGTEHTRRISLWLVLCLAAGLCPAAACASA